MKGYTVIETVRLTGYPKTLIAKKIWTGEIGVNDGMVTQEAMMRIMDEKEQFVSLAEFARDHSGGNFNGRLNADRIKLYDYLTENDFFGFPTTEIENILMSTDADIIYFLREDIPAIEDSLAEFFRNYGLTEKEKIKNQLREHQKTHENTCKLLRDYIEDVALDADDFPPSVTEFVGLMLSMPDVQDLMPDDIEDYMQSEVSVAARKHMVRFLNFCRDRAKVKYSQVRIKKRQGKPLRAYTSDQYIAMMRCVFNADYIADHMMIEKALKNHLYAETWLYISLFLTCGWRSSDICSGWQYPRLAEREDIFLEINRETLWEDILHDRIPDNIYEDVCRYCIASVAAAELLPQKNWMRNATTLRDAITPELHTFYGLLTLIGEAHMIRTGVGYLDLNRKNDYQNKRTLSEFFGSEMMVPLKGRHLESRRLNKVFLQGIEKTARQNGNSGLLASAVASYARNHTSMDTISHYLRDHTLDGETAETILYFMLQRGVFGFEYYRVLIVAYPDAFQKLTVKDQNRLIAIMDETPLSVEIKQAGLLANMEIREQFEKAAARDSKENEQEFSESNFSEVITMMHAMLEISQSRGKGKDDGIHCLKRAMGEACAHPEYDSCMTNACPHLVFTRHGVRPLVMVLKEYITNARTDRKANAVLKNVIIPKFQGVINALMREMDAQERAGMQKMISDALREE